MASETGSWGGDAKLKRLGDRVIPSPISIVQSGFQGRPDLEARFDVLDGQLQCRNVTLTAVGDQEIQRQDLKAISLDSLRETVAANWSMPVRVEDGERVVSLLDLASFSGETDHAKKNLAATRRRSDAEHLEQVAHVYLTAERAPTQAVADHFGVAHRTAGLYVQRARRTGLIPAAKRGK